MSWSKAVTSKRSVSSPRKFVRCGNPSRTRARAFAIRVNKSKSNQVNQPRSRSPRKRPGLRTTHKPAQVSKCESVSKDRWIRTRNFRRKSDLYHHAFYREKKRACGVRTGFKPREFIRKSDLCQNNAFYEEKKSARRTHCIQNKKIHKKK